MRQKSILITGANRGIGLQAAKELAAQGHRIYLTARNKHKGKEAAKLIEGDVHVYQLDVTDKDSVKELAAELDKAGVTLDVLINNAGSVFDDMSKDDLENPLDTSLKKLRETFELNFFGAYLVTKNLLPLLNRKERADIINVSSGMGAMTDMGGGAPAYRFSKTAMNSMTVYLANALAPTTIRVNSICPGWVRTELGGPNAPRSLEEGVVGINWIVNEEPDLNGKFIRDKEIIAF